MSSPHSVTQVHHHYTLNDLKKEKKWAYDLTIAAIVIGILLILAIGPGVIIHKIVSFGKKAVKYGEHELDKLGGYNSGVTPQQRQQWENQFNKTNLPVSWNQPPGLSIINQPIGLGNQSNRVTGNFLPFL